MLRAPIRSQPGLKDVSNKYCSKGRQPTYEAWIHEAAAERKAPPLVLQIQFMSVGSAQPAVLAAEM